MVAWTAWATSDPALAARNEKTHTKPSLPGGLSMLAKSYAKMKKLPADAGSFCFCPVSRLPASGEALLFSGRVTAQRW